MTLKPAIYTAASIVAFIIICALLFRFCQKPAKVVTQRKEQLRDIQAERAFKDSVAAAYRFKLDSVATHYQSRVSKVEVRYLEVKAKGRQTEIKYIKDPTAENCEEAIASKNRRIYTLEELDSVRVRQIQNDRLRLAAADTLNSSLRQTNQKLTELTEKTIKDLNKAKRKKHFVISAGVTTGLNKDLEHQNIVGVSFGYKLAQF